MSWRDWGLVVAVMVHFICLVINGAAFVFVLDGQLEKALLTLFIAHTFYFVARRIRS